MSQLSKREKILATLVGGVLLLIINVFLISFFIDNFGSSRRKETDKLMQLHGMQALIVDTATWQERETWTQTHQPKLDSEERAGVEFLNASIALAEKNGMTVDAKGIEGVVRKSQYTGIMITFQTKSSWKALLAFMEQMQGPEKFVVFTDVDLRIDSADKTLMVGKFKMSKWYAVK